MLGLQCLYLLENNVPGFDADSWGSGDLVYKAVRTIMPSKIAVVTVLAVQPPGVHGSVVDGVDNFFLIPPVDCFC